MTFKYKNKKTGEIKETKTAMNRAEKKDYILLSWRKNVAMKSREITKK